MLKTFLARQLPAFSRETQSAFLPGGDTCLGRCRYGWMLTHRHDLYIGRSLQHYGEYCQGEADLLAPYLSAGDWVIDAGANVGSMALFFARAVNSSGRVYALEPQRVIFQMLCANAALNELDNVRALHAAAGAHSGSIKVDQPDYSRPNNFAAMPLGEWQQGDEVRLLRLDELALEHCRLIKIDVEGMEQAVLEGAASTIARHRPLLYIENDREDKAEGLLRHVATLDYRIYRHVSAYFNPDNFLGKRDNIFENVFASNMLCIPAGSGVSAPALEEVIVPAG